jgi:peptidoglycan/xylan/chitin deacetylase (PgdA/CDA1 family)
MTRRLARVYRRLRPPRPRPVILMYHRVAAPLVDPWELAVHPDRFAAQLDVLRSSRRPLAMAEFVERARRGTLPRDAVAITFDDGYADTLREAKPRLAAAGVPATLFLATAFVDQRVEYWWDELARGLLLRAEALDDDVVIDGQRCRLAVAAAGDAIGVGAPWRASDEPRTEREALYYAIWKRLRVLGAAEVEAAMTRLRAVLRPPAPRPDDLPMTASEVAELAADGLFEIGGHTATHPVLPTLSAAERRREIREGQAACQRLTDKAPVGFAYPYGANDGDSRTAVGECGFEWACTTEARPVAAAEADWYALPRIQVLDWDAASFEQALWRASA